MAKIKTNKAGHPYFDSAGGVKYYRNAEGQITDENGKRVLERYGKILEEQFAVEEEQLAKIKKPRQPKEKLEAAFPEAYKEPRERKRKAKPEKDLEQQESQQYKRDNQELKGNIGSISSLMRENNALIRQQLTSQQRSITILTEIAKNIGKGGGGDFSLPSIGKGLGWKSLLAAGAAGVALGGIGGYELSNFMQPEEQEPETPAPSAESGTQQPQQTSAIQQAQQRGSEKKTDVINIQARELSFNSDKLGFEVNELTIDADKITTVSRAAVGGTSTGGGASTGGEGGGGGTGGGGGGGGAVATPQGEFKPNVETPSFAGTEGGKGAYSGFQKSPLTSIEATEQARTLRPSSEFVGGAQKAKPGDVAAGSKEAYDFWKGKGLTHEQALGMVAQERTESKHDPNARGDSGTAHGLYQWHADRRKAILEGTGIDVSTAPTAQQREASWWELNHKETNAFKQLKASKTVLDAVKAGLAYERPADMRPGYRYNVASEVEKDIGKVGAKEVVAKTVKVALPQNLTFGAMTGSLLGPQELTGGKIIKAPLSPELAASEKKVEVQKQEAAVVAERKASEPERLARDELGERNVAAERAALEQQLTTAASPLSPGFAGARSLTAVESLMPMPEQPATTSQNLAPPQTPPTASMIGSQKYVQGTGFSGDKPSVASDKTEESEKIKSRVAWKDTSVHPAFGYLFPKESKFGLQLGSN